MTTGKLEIKVDSFLIKLEASANYKDSHSLLLLERIKNETIKQRLINDLYFDLATSERDILTENELNILSKEEGEAKNLIREALGEKLNLVFSFTDIEYSEIGYVSSNSSGQGGTIGIFCKNSNSNTNEFFEETTLIKNITESHEKGHLIRDYHQESDFSKKLLAAFDYRKVSFSFDELEFIKKLYLHIYSEIPEEEEIVSMAIKEISSTKEIVERMSQLKNYFGMSGEEKFTKEHLKYARKNYIKDTGMHPLQIKPFFEAISNEDEFILLMNTLGI